MEVTEQLGPIVVPPEHQWNSPKLLCYNETCRCAHSERNDSNDLHCGAQASRQAYTRGNIWTLVRKLENINAWGCPFQDEPPKGIIMTWSEKVEMVNLSQFPERYAELMAFIDARIADVDEQGLEMVVSVVEVVPARIREFEETYRKIVARYTKRDEVYSYVTDLRIQLIRATLTGLALKNPEMATFTGWKAVYDTMPDREKDFVRQVRDSNRCRVGVARYNGDGLRAVWELPEELGLVVCIGSYKWQCTAPDALLEGSPL